MKLRSTGFSLDFASSLSFLIHGPRVFTIQNGSVNELGTQRQIWETHIPEESPIKIPKMKFV